MIKKKRILSQEHKDKIAAKALGRKHSKEAKEKIANREIKQSTRDKLRFSMFGKKKSPLHSENIKSALEKQWSDFSDEERERRIEALQSNSKTKDTSLELKFEEMLKSKNISYKKQYRVGRYKADFYLLDHNLLVEVNGCYWHQCELCGHNSGHHGKTAKEHRESDLKRAEYFKSKGYQTKFIWEHQLNDRNNILRQ